MDPDYTSYTLKELLESLDSIDEESYPERVDSIKIEIKKRKSSNENIAPSNEKMENSQYGNSPQLILLCLGIISLFLGGLALMSGEVIGRRGYSYTKAEDPVIFYTITILLLAAGISFFLYIYFKRKERK